MLDLLWQRHRRVLRQHRHCWPALLWLRYPYLQTLSQGASHSYNMFKFQMAITVAHEVIHHLISYLTGKKQPHTPPGVSLASYGNTATGESGCYWESRLLGGVLTLRQVQVQKRKERLPTMTLDAEAGHQRVCERLRGQTGLEIAS